MATAKKTPPAGIRAPVAACPHCGKKDTVQAHVRLCPKNPNGPNFKATAKAPAAAPAPPAPPAPAEPEQPAEQPAAPPAPEAPAVEPEVVTKTPAGAKDPNAFLRERQAELQGQGGSGREPAAPPAQQPATTTFIPNGRFFLVLGGLVAAGGVAWWLLSRRAEKKLAEERRAHEQAQRKAPARPPVQGRTAWNPERGLDWNNPASHVPSVYGDDDK